MRFLRELAGPLAFTAAFAAAQSSPRALGRCIDAGTRRPVAGAEVYLAGARAHSLGDGSFDLPLAVHGDLLPTLIVSAAGYSRHRRVVAERTAAGKLDLGELELHPGLDATTTVTDTRGLPQEHVRVELLSLAPVPPWMPWQVVARSDRSGALRFPEPLPAGRYSVTLLSPHILASPAVVELRPDQALAALVVQPGVLHVVEGILVDPSGAPIRGFEVHGRATQLLATVTDHEGRFCFLRPKDDACDAITIEAPAQPGYAPLARTSPTPWGTRNLCLTADHGVPIELRVLDAETKVAVDAFQIALHAVPSEAGSDPWEFDGTNWTQLPPAPAQKIRPLASPPAGGRTTILGVPSGHYLLVVVAGGSRYPAPTLVPVRAFGPKTSVEAELRPGIQRRVLLRSPSGAPVVGSRIRAVIAPDDAEWNSSTILESPTQLLHHHRGPRFVEIGAATTDAQGEATLTVPLRTPIRLWASGPDHVPKEKRNQVFDHGDEPALLTVDVGVTVRGALVPRALVHELWLRPGLRLRAASPVARGSPTMLPLGPPRLFPIGADGCFELTGIPAGTWHLEIQGTVLREAGNSRTYRQASTTRLTTLHNLEAGTERDLVLDLSPFRPAILQGTIRHEGLPVPNARFQVFTRPSAEPQGVWTNCVSGETNWLGRFTAEVDPGQACVLVTPSWSDDSHLLVPCAETLDTVAERRFVETFTLRRWTAAIRVLDPSGKPLQGKPIVLDARPEIPWSGSATTDAEGVARFDSPPLVPLHAGFTDDRPFGTITPPGDLGSEVEHQFVLRLPRSAR
jgi:hypothetical protein